MNTQSMDFAAAITTRYSARKFTGRPVPHETISKILGLARHTASWCNTQPWQLVITSGEATERFREALWQHAAAGNPPEPDFSFPPKYVGVYQERRKICGVQLYEAIGVKREDKLGAMKQMLENFRFFGAPHVALLTTEETLAFYGGVDCGLFINSFMLAARSVGVDCIAQAALASYPGFIRNYFGLPENRKLVCGISFGYADADHPINAYRTERVTVDEMVRWEE
jgi:nitroreductase